MSVAVTCEKSPRPAVAETARPVPCDRRRILVVDDVNLIVSTFERALSLAFPDITVDTAANGREAVEIFSRWHQAVLILDLRMPVLDGHAAFLEIRELCSRQGWEMPAVVFCTGYAPTRTVHEIVEVDGRHGLMLKPVEIEDLIRAVRARL